MKKNYKYNKHFLIADTKSFLKEILAPQSKINSKVSVKKIRKKMIKNKLAFNEDETPSWFYTAYDRKDADPLTNYTLNKIIREEKKESKILITGCGTGIMVFYLLNKKFKHIDGFDYLDKCIEITNFIKKEGRYTGCNFWQDDGFSPKKITKKYDIITAMHWVFSAWMGNYGNKIHFIEDLKKPKFRKKLLKELLIKYTPYLNKNGKIIIELTDAIADYRLNTDIFNFSFNIPFFYKRKTEKNYNLESIYPVRLSYDQVKEVAKELKLNIIDAKLCITHGHQPRMSYVLQKID